jgi:hypothetical protein
MVLLSQMFRTAAITGRTDAYDASWFAGRQGGRWAEQTVGAAFQGRRRPDPAPRNRELDELQRRGVLSETEADALRARLGL